jgi:sulfonate transport system substrate-binding protein
VDWTLSQGSHRALEFLNGNSIDFGSSAGAAALIAKSNGNPIYGVWTALVSPRHADGLVSARRVHRRHW